MKIEKLKAALLTIFFLIGSGIFLINGCGKAPPKPPPVLIGAIRVIAQIDSTMVDSMEVILDGASQGVQTNPCILMNLEAGKHQVAVSKEDPESPINFTCSPQLVSVNKNETTNVKLALTKLAPNFTLKNLNNDDVTLENYHGKVVLMVFYSHT